MDQLVKLSISMPYFVWRDGRPRWQPNKRLISEGWSGVDLKHPDGTWLSVGECEAWVRQRMVAVADQRRALAAARAAKRKAPRLSRPGPTGWPLADAAEAFIGMMEERLRDEIAMRDRQAAEGVEEHRRLRLTLARATVRDYRNKLRWLIGWDRNHAVKDMGPLGAVPLEAMSTVIMSDLYERLRLGVSEHAAAGAMRALSAMYSWAIRKRGLRVTGNPCFRLGMRTPEERLRAGSVAEIEHLIRAADLIGLPEVGDMVMLGVWTAQRQADRLELVLHGIDANDRVTLRQNKTRARVSIPSARQLKERLLEARQRHLEKGHTGDRVVRSSATGKPLKGDYYRKLYQKVVAAAVAGIPGELEPMPSLADLRDADLRDTAVTWLALADCNLEEIRSITGHSRESILKILNHYIAEHDRFADAGIAKLEQWYDVEAQA